jgi:hypothetical protein
MSSSRSLCSARDGGCRLISVCKASRGRLKRSGRRGGAGGLEGLVAGWSLATSASRSLPLPFLSLTAGGPRANTLKSARCCLSGISFLNCFSLCAVMNCFCSSADLFAMRSCSSSCCRSAACAGASAAGGLPTTAPAWATASPAAAGEEWGGGGGGGANELTLSQKYH